MSGQSSPRSVPVGVTPHHPAPPRSSAPQGACTPGFQAGFRKGLRCLLWGPDGGKVTLGPITGISFYCVRVCARACVYLTRFVS